MGWGEETVNDTHSFKLPFNVNPMTVILIVFGCCDNLCYGRNCYGYGYGYCNAPGVRDWERIATDCGVGMKYGIEEF